MYSSIYVLLTVAVIWSSNLCGVQAECTVETPPTGFKITSGEAVGATVADGGTITYDCDTDYTSDSGAGTVSCGGTTWTGPILTCKGCPAPALDSTMERTPTTTEAAIVDDTNTLTYTCLSGYGTSAANEVITCNGNSWSSSVTLKCGCEAPTLASTMERSPTTTDGDIITDSNTLTYTCKTGYTNSAANEVATCTGSTNTWNPASLSLTCKGCAAPTLDSTMDRTPTTADGDIVGDTNTLTYTCKSGYGKSAANEVITCNGNTWSSAVTLKCGCEAPTLASTMERTPTTADGGIIADSVTLTYTCKTGYTNSTANEVATCTGNTNTWNPASLTLTCTVPAGDCAVGTVDAKYKDVTQGQIVTNGSTVTYACADGYTNGSGSGVSTCTSGTLSAPTLVCTGCPAPVLDSKMERSPTTADGTIVADTNKLTYNCKTGYTASTTDEELTCNTNAWSPAAPTLTCTTGNGNGAEKTLTGEFSLLIMTVTMTVFYL